MRYPKTLYETPNSWGEVFWLSRQGLDQAIASLRRLWRHDPLSGFSPGSVASVTAMTQECIRWEHVGGGFYRKTGVRKEDQETRYFRYDQASRSWIPEREVDYNVLPRNHESDRR